MSAHSTPSRSWLIYGTAIAIFGLGVWYFGFRTELPKMGGNPWRSRGGNQAVPVRAVEAAKTSLPVHLRAIGTVTPLNTVIVRSRVEGQLLRVNFEEGQPVKEGALLAEVDPLPYKLKLTQAEAKQRSDVAQLQTVRADLERTKLLFAQNLVTQQQLEAQQALVADREGVLAADQSLVEDARRQLDYTRIEAPISGRLGLRQMDAGNVVRPSDAAGLVVITRLQPINVLFTVPEIDLQKVLEPLRAGQTLPVEAWDRGENTLLAAGSLRTIDNQIDLATGTLRLKAEFANQDEKLFPNQFVNVRLRVKVVEDAIVIPSAAVQFGSRGTYVYVVDEEGKARVRDIELGASDNARQAVTKGLAVGEKVILEGLDRLRDGRAVSLLGPSGLGPPATPPAPGAPGAPGAKDDKGGRGERKKKG
jgi:multidrug efflux system membrane fusion protein